jgi:hypothetical protein
MKNATKNANTDATKIESRKRYWLADNPGVLKRIAEEAGVVPSFVSDVFHGRRTSKGGLVEGKLSERGAPGFEDVAA